MKTEMLLKIQSWVDGCLSAAESSELAAFVAANPDAQALVSELRMTKAALRGNEAPVAMTESREFFWSKIERDIARQEREAVAAELPGLGWWRRLLLPVSGFAALALVAGVAVLANRGDNGADRVESLAEDVKPFTHDAPGMKVIWIDRDEPMSAEPMSIDNIETK